MSPSANTHPYRKAFIWGAIWLLILAIIAGARLTAFGLGRQIAATLIAAAITGFFASRSQKGWSFARAGLWYPLTLLVVLFLESYGASQRG